jgi:hypothetical protein
MDLAVFEPADLETETVGAEIDGGEACTVLHALRAGSAASIALALPRHFGHYRIHSAQGSLCE